MLTKSGRLVTFSGVDLAGKTTQISNLYRYIEEGGGKPFYYWSRGGYTGPVNFLKRFVRQILGKKLPPPGHSPARSELFQKTFIRNTWVALAILDLIFIYGIYFRFLKMCGFSILADRYIYDTRIDFEINFPDLEIEKRMLWKLLDRLFLKPDCSFFLIISAEESMKRSLVKKEPFPSSRKITNERIERYHSLKDDPLMICIDCMEPEEDVSNMINTIYRKKTDQKQELCE